MTTFIPAEPHHITVISELAHRIWPDYYKDMIPAGQLAGMLAQIYSHENLLRQLQGNERFWLVEDEGEYTGYFSCIPDDGYVCLKKLYLLPETRGRGLGRKMVEFAASQYPHYQEMRVFLNENNEAAMQFYTKTGFSLLGKEKLYMGSYLVEDFVMARPVNLTPAYHDAITSPFSETTSA